MHFFGRRDTPSDGQGPAYDQIRKRIDNALTTIFTEDGKRAVLYYMTEKYSLTLEQASIDPGRLEDALTSMLGEIGWMVVKKKILEQFYGRNDRMALVHIETASLRDAFGSLHSILSSSSPGRVGF